jgi:hypothetical protein
VKKLGTNYEIITNADATKIGRKLKIEYEDKNNNIQTSTVDIDIEIDKYIALFKERNPNATVKDFRFNELDLCSGMMQSIDAAMGFDADLVVCSGTLGNLNNSATIMTYIKEKEGNFIAPNGGGNCYVFDDFGKLLDQFRSTIYHGIYIFESEKVLYSGYGILLKNQKFKLADYYITDKSIKYLKDMQRKCEKDRKEYGGLCTVKNNELIFEECIPCRQTSEVQEMKAEDVTKFSNYVSNNQNIDYRFTWHTHINDVHSQKPSAGIASDPTGDLVIFTLDPVGINWQNEFIGAASQVAESIYLDV